MLKAFKAVMALSDNEFYSGKTKYNQNCFVVCLITREILEKMKVHTQFQTSAELERLQETLLSKLQQLC